MPGLKQRLIRLIEATGPISVADYMAACLLDPLDGYYTTRQPFGTRGDFVTAPEISQMFGELLAVWIYSAWEALDRPQPVTLAEIGPGRGTLFRDMVRTLASLDSKFARTASFCLVEASPMLAGLQREALADSGVHPAWHESVTQLPPQATLFVGNEIFDALPMHQYVKSREGWRERRIGLDAEGRLNFVVGAGVPDSEVLPPDAAKAAPGAVFELAPARTALMDEIADHIAAHRGAGLFVDYGYGVPATGDTLQAVRDHNFDAVLEHPGEADLTSHVDFARLRSSAGEHGLDSHLQSQGAFLCAMGLVERAGVLGSGADSATQRSIEADVERLAGPQQMGELFKVLAILPHGTTVHPFSAPD